MEGDLAEVSDTDINFDAVLASRSEVEKGPASLGKLALTLTSGLA